MRLLLVRHGAQYDHRYVASLTRQAIRHAGVTETVCLTDQSDTPGTCRALRTDLVGWWAKLELFAPWNADLRPAIYFDLDTLIVAEVAPVPLDRFLMIRDLDQRNWPGRMASGAMAIPADTDRIWNGWNRGLVERARYGDAQAVAPFCEGALQDIVGGIVSYKIDRCGDAPKGAIICFHGQPKPHNCGGWAQDYWLKHCEESGYGPQ